MTHIHKHFLIALLVFVIGISQTACGVEKKTSSQSKYYIWYLGEEEKTLEKVNYEISGKTDEEQVKNILEALENPSKNENYKSVFGKNVAILNWKLKDSKLSIDFNGAYTDMTATEELLFRAAVVQSLCQLDGVSYVLFSVEGATLKNSENEEIGYMNDDSFVQNIGMTLHNYQEQNFTLYYANQDGSKLVKETRKVRYNSNKSKEKVIIEQLLNGPEELENLATIPSDTKLLGVTIRDDICYVNLDGEFLEEDYEVSATVRIYSIVNSIIENDVAKQVQILINGSANVNYQGIVDLSRPLTLNKEIVEE